jgi:hypothetical protein
MYQPQLFENFTPTPKLRLSQVIDYLDQTQALGPAPSRQTLINWLEEGTLRGVNVNGFGWLVYRDSLYQFLNSLETNERMAA